MTEKSPKFSGQRCFDCDGDGSLDYKTFNFRF